jgi:hypothetical protein
MRAAVAIAVALLVVAAAGCPTPELGVAPFFCNNGEPECPDGYRCLKNVCVREGSGPVVADARAKDGRPRERGAGEGGAPDGKQPPDGAQPPDRAPDTRPHPDAPPPKAGVVVSELLANPKAVSDADGEWLELFNPGAAPVDVNGWTLKDKGSDLHVIAAAGGSLVVPALGYLVLGRSTQKSANGGVNVAYAYSGFLLSNSADEVILLDKSGKTVESFSYGTASGFVIPDGASLSVKSPGADKNLPASWCEETKAWPGSAGDKGSPGAAPGC